MANYKAGNIYIDIQAQQQKAVDGIKKTIAQLRILKNVINSTQKVNETINKTTSVAVKSQKRLEKTNAVTKQLESNSKKASNNFDKMFSFGKIYVFLNYAKRIAQVFIDIVSSAINFNETLNKFEVAMGGNYERALGFVNSLTKAFNLSTQSIMDYQSTFMNMLSALEGLNEDTSYMLSETLTRMGVDFASLFNVSVDRAMSMFQSALSGQVRAIRSISGYDITQSTYYSLYQSIGGEKSVRQLTMIEKRLLVILAIQKQMEKTGAVGDFEKTINYTANQLKQLSETFKEITMYIGQFALYYIKPYIENVLAFAIAIREILSSAYDKATNKVVEENVEGVTNKFEKANEEIEDLTDNAESAKKSLLGFDKINTIGSNDNSGIGSDVGLIVEQLGKYQSSLDGVTSKAQETSEEILKWLGYTRDENGELEKTGSTMDYILTTMKLVGTILGGTLIFGSIKNIQSTLTSVFGKVVNGIDGIYNKLFMMPASLSNMVLIGSAIVAVLALMYATNEDFRKSVDTLIKSLVDMLVPIMAMVMDIVNALMPIITTILDALANILIPILDAITPILATITMLFESLEPAIKLVANIIGGVLQSVLGVLLTAIEPFVFIIQVIIDLLSGLVQLIIGVVIGAIEAVMGVVYSLIEIFKGLEDIISALFSGDLTRITDAFSKVGEKLKDIWSNVWKSIKNTFGGIINNIITMFESFINSFIRRINSITSSISALWTWMGIPEIGQISEISLPKLKMEEEINASVVGETNQPNLQNETNAYDEMTNMLGGISMPVANALLGAINENTKAVKQSGNTTIEVNGQKLAEATYGDYQNVATRKGVTSQMAFGQG